MNPRTKMLIELGYAGLMFCVGATWFWEAFVGGGEPYKWLGIISVIYGSTMWRERWKKL